MKLVIEGTPSEIADAMRRLAAPEDIKPVFVPYERRVTSPFVPYIGDYPPPATDSIPPWWLGERVTTGGIEITFPQSMCGTVVKDI